MARVLASADIGSNTVHLLIAETDGKRIRRLENRSEWLALGETVARTGQIPEDSAAMLLRILKEFRQIASAYRADEFYVFATEAVRAAENHDEVLERIRRDNRITVDVITPRKEAEFSLRGTLLDCGPYSDMTLFEVGGGSAQIAHVADGELKEEVSLPLGTGRLIAHAGLANPSRHEAIESVRAYIRENLATVRSFPWRAPVVASGGVIRGLWRAVHPDGERELALEEISYLGWAAARLTVDRAAARFNCKFKRAATLLPGALVYEELLRHSGAAKVEVSEFGVREGAILSMAQGKVAAWLG